MDAIRELLEALANAARDGRKSEFDRLERELLTNFAGSFDAMPADVYEQYLEIDRLWPAIAPSPTGVLSPSEVAAARRSSLQVSLTTQDEAWLRQIGEQTDRSLSAVLTACVAMLRADDALADAVRRQLEGPARSD